MSETQTDRQ